MKRTPDVVDISSDAAPPVERLRLTALPTGFRFDIDDISGIADYTVVVEHSSGRVYGTKPTRHTGTVDISDIARLPGKWVGLLLADQKVVHTTELEVQFTEDLLVDMLGEVQVRFAGTDGPTDRLGATRVEIWDYIPDPDRGLTPYAEEAAICVMFPDFPDVMPTPRPEVVVSIHRPDGVLYVSDTYALTKLIGLRFKIYNYAPCVLPGAWRVTVDLSHRRLVETEFWMRAMDDVEGSGRPIVLLTEDPVEYFDIRVS